jgi:mono/diheme cytochrome c family protein
MRGHDLAARRLLAVAAYATSLLCAGCDEDLLNPMAARQPRVQNYSQSDFYSDGMAMREPPAGTVPRDRIVMNAGLTLGRVLGPKGEVYATSIPMKVDRPLMELGQKRFNITCATCHGPVGDGDSLVARQMALKPPPSLHDFAKREPGYIYDVITRGFGMMASYAAELPVRDRWAVVAYVQALQLSQSASLDQVPPEERARLEAMPKETR